MDLRVTATRNATIERGIVQGKRLTVKAKRSGARSALVDIGNKTTRNVPNLRKPFGIKPNQDECKSDEVVDRLEKMDFAKVDHVQPMPTLPEGVIDIDSNESDDPQLCAEYTPFMYAYLRQLETQFTIKKDFLKGCNVNGKMRAVLLDWLIEVHLQFKLLQETLYMTVFIIDRFLQVEGLTIKRNKLQLVGVAAMFTASKVEEVYAPEVNDFVYITDNAYTSEEIRQMQLRILSTLNFGLGRPLPLHFLRRNSKAGDVDVLQHTVAKYIIELAQLEYDMAHLSPSIIAAGSLYLSLLVTSPGATWNPTLAYYSNYTHNQLTGVVSKLASILIKAPESKMKAVYTKYQSRKYMKVADMEEVRGEVVNQLAQKKLPDIV